MPWNKIASAAPLMGRPVLVRTIDNDKAEAAFLGPDGIWYSGGALVQSSTTVLAAIPTE